MRNTSVPLKNVLGLLMVILVLLSTGAAAAEELLAEKDNPQADVVWGTAATSLMLCDQSRHG